uniref:EF-hand and coiled-coil domain containing 1 n=1 Tax=Ictidomys tridecemlineatus TaxID=43179 RepID=I3MRZ0_ICTTR
DPYRRPARRTQWLLSALAHHYGLDRGVENEIVVLATGLDQYLQEVFHHLDCRGAGRLPRSDFRALCAVLGLRAEGTASGEATGDAIPGDSGDGTSSGDVAADGDADAQEEARLALRAEPPELTFRQFHARLCGYFGTRAGPRLPRGALSEHIETQIRLRRPRRRRRRQHPTQGGAHLLPPGPLTPQVGLWKSQAGAPEAVARELRQAQGALAAAEARAGRLQQGQAEVRRRAEEARQAVLRSLSRVRELEALAQQVPSLQRWVQQLEAELQLGDRPQPFISPRLCGARPSSRGMVSLFRSVEGQAASDEEEEEDETWRRQKRPPEARAEWPSGCQGGYVVGGHQVGLPEPVEGKGPSFSGKALGTPVEELEPKELRIETERVRLSLLEEKLADVLQLLQRLLDLNISKRALGQILLSTLDAWRNPAQEGAPGPSAVLDALHRALAGCELLQRPPPGQASPNPALANPLVLSC